MQVSISFQLPNESWKFFGTETNSQRSHEWEQQVLYGTLPLLADGKVSRRERGLFVFTCCTRRRNKVDIVNYMTAKDEGNLEVHGCVLFTNHKLKFIQGPLQDDWSSQDTGLNFCSGFWRSCFGMSVPRTANFLLFYDCSRFSRKMLTARLLVLWYGFLPRSFQYVILAK